MISVDFEKLKELYEIVNRFEGSVNENLSRAEAQASGITASGDKLLSHLNEIKRFLDDEISRYQKVERKLNEKANEITFKGKGSLNAVNIDRISERINSPSPSPYEAFFKPFVSGGDASLENRSSKVELKSEKEENIIDKTLKAADEKVNSAVNMAENTANELKNFAEKRIEDADNAIKSIEESIKVELAELTRQINSVLEEIFKTFENKNFQKAGTDFLVLLAFKVEELTTNNKEELKVLPKFEDECENKLSEDFDNFKADAWNEFSKSHPEGAKLLKDTSNKINDLQEIIKKSWEIYKKIDPEHAGMIAGTYTFVKETVEIPYEAAEFCGKQWYNLMTDTKGTLLSWLDTSQKVYDLLNPQIPKTAEQLEFEGNLFNSIKNSVDKNLINGDEYTRSKFGTEVVLNIATLFSGKGALKAVSETGKMEDTVRFTKGTSEMSKLEKGTSYAEKMSELSSKLKDLGKASEEMFKNTLSEILSLQKSISERFGGITEKLKSIGKEVKVKSDAKEFAKTAEKSEVEEKSVNDIISEKNEGEIPKKVDNDIKKMDEGGSEGKIENNSENESMPKNEQLNDVKDSGTNEEINTKVDEAKGVGESSKVDSNKYFEISKSHPIVEETQLNTSIENIRMNKELSPFEEAFSKAMENENMTMDEYIKLTHTSMSELSETDIKRVYAVNSSVDNPTNATLMSKAIPEKTYVNYIRNGKFSDSVGNCVTRAQDMQDCYTFDDYYNKLGLNYDNNPFDTADKMYVMRYMSHDTEALVTRSYGGTTIEDVKTAQNVLGLNENNTFLNKEPYLGTGVTKDVEGGIGKMELMTMKDNAGNAQYCKVSNGSAIYEISRGDITEKIVAIRFKGKWWKVN